MATREMNSVDVHEREDFDRFLECLDRYRESRITLDLGGEADVLNSAAEFARLAELANSNDIEISMATIDPLRQELARIFGFAIVDSPALASTAFLDRRDLQTTIVRRSGAVISRDGQDSEVSSRQSSSPVSNGDGGLLAPKGGPVLDPDASFSFVIATADARPLHFSPTTELSVQSQAFPESFSPAKTRRRQTRRAVNVGALVASVLVIVAAVSVLLLGLLAPAASIVLIPETRAISGEIVVGAGADGASLDLAIQPEPVSTVLTYQSSVPVTGERQVPDQPARGMVFVTNPASRPILIPANTSLFTADGALQFTTTEDIDVPAADPFGSATFGTAVVSVIAAEPGPESNLGTGELIGELESGVMFQNRFPLEGGSLKLERFVIGDDHARLMNQANEALTSQIANALDDFVLPGWELVDPPGAPQQLQAIFSAEAGAVADEVSIEAELLVEGQMYEPQGLFQSARNELGQELEASVDDGFEILPDSIEFSGFEPVAIDRGVAFILRGEAVTRAVLDPYLESTLADDLVGRSEANATEAVSSIDGLQGFQVSYGPDWLPWDPIPRLSSRITVDVREP